MLKVVRMIYIVQNTTQTKYYISNQSFYQTPMQCKPNLILQTNLLSNATEPSSLGNPFCASSQSLPYALLSPLICLVLRGGSSSTIWCPPLRRTLETIFGFGETRPSSSSFLTSADHILHHFHHLTLLLLILLLFPTSVDQFERKAFFKQQMLSGKL